MNDSDQLKVRFQKTVPGASEERWDSLLSQVDELARIASRGALDGLLQELSELEAMADARGDRAATLLDLPNILAWRLSAHFRNAAAVMEAGRKPESMEAGWDEEMDEYRLLWSD